MLKSYNPWGKPGGGAPRVSVPLSCTLFLFSKSSMDLQDLLKLILKNEDNLERFGHPLYYNIIVAF